MPRANAKALRARVKTEQEAARKARHEKRFGEEGRLKRAMKKAEEAFVRLAENKIRKDRRRFTEQGYADLRAQAKEQIQKQIVESAL